MFTIPHTTTQRQLQSRCGQGGKGGGKLGHPGGITNPRSTARPLAAEHKAVCHDAVRGPHKVPRRVSVVLDGQRAEPGCRGVGAGGREGGLVNQRGCSHGCLAGLPLQTPSRLPPPTTTQDQTPNGPCRARACEKASRQSHHPLASDCKAVHRVPLPHTCVA